MCSPVNNMSCLGLTLLEEVVNQMLAVNSSATNANGPRCVALAVTCLGQYWGDVMFRNGEILVVKYRTRQGTLWPQFTAWFYSWKARGL